MRRILITGGSGFIGRHVVSMLVRVIGAEDRIFALRRNHQPPVVAPSVQWREGDLLQSEWARECVRDICPTHLIHLAWHVAHGVFWQSPMNHRWKEASVELLNAALEAGARFVIAIGSCAEYKWGEAACVEDDTPLLPKTPYGRAKAEFYREASEHCAQEGSRLAWLRPFYVYGKGEPPNKLISSMIRGSLEFGAIELTSPERRLDFVHVTDVAAAIVHAFRHGLDGSYNVGSGKGMTVEDAADVVARICQEKTNRPVRVSHAAHTRREDDVVANIKRLSSSGWQYRVSLEDGVREMVGDMTTMFHVNG
jgi:nucleoside-diphosphate-sugar epimerase